MVDRCSRPRETMPMPPFAHHDPHRAAPHTRAAVSDSNSPPTSRYTLPAVPPAALAQSAERLTRNEKVVGSIPTGGSTRTPRLLPGGSVVSAPMPLEAPGVLGDSLRGVPQAPAEDIADVLLATLQAPSCGRPPRRRRPRRVATRSPHALAAITPAASRSLAQASAVASWLRRPTHRPSCELSSTAARSQQIARVGGV